MTKATKETPKKKFPFGKVLIGAALLLGTLVLLDKFSDKLSGLPSVPTELRDHVLLQDQDSGVSGTLTGDVLITVIFVNDPTSTWTDALMESTKAGDAAMTTEIQAEAASYGAELNITMEYRQATVGTSVDGDSAYWAERIIVEAGLGSLATASADLESSRGVKEAPILFYLNASKRSYANPSTEGDTEYAIIWNCGSDTVTYRHELYHLFSAKDYYYPEEISQTVLNYFPNSTMLTAEDAVTDDLTAYLIGWTDTLSDDALAFLRETAHVTAEDVAEASRKKTYTGYVENWEDNGNYITGYLDMGVLEGQGKVVYADGSSYEGYFVYGSLHGQGKIVYADGGRYEGNFDHGAFSGEGTFYWENGDSFTGQWKDGLQNGYGTYTWADGNSFSGTWENGNYIG